MDSPADQQDAAMPGEGAVRLCASSELSDGGRGVRFVVPSKTGLSVPAFAVRHQGRVHAYLNRCAHVPMELDLQEGRFFDLSGDYLICATHGAMYEPADGRCIAGPCHGASLTALHVVEHADAVFWLPSPSQ
ncbi:MAG: Rieske 2Fe-2S domain-containing protein [Candidatus Protistobacter heckmanni]|nr:Rieske 2Fe-2S domain-containing protein [Candidatus Protistobacter heckmanni]